MKKLCTLALLGIILAVSLTGCIQATATIEINKDGSGTGELTYSLSQAVVEAQAEMKELGMDNSDDMSIPSISDIDKKKLETEGKKHGVKINKFETKMVNGRETLTLSIEFKDLKGLSYVMSKSLGNDPNEGIGIFDTGDGNYVLRSATYDFSASEDVSAIKENEDSSDDLSMENMDPAKMQAQMGIMTKMMGAMAELQVRMDITVPGDIVTSNAPKTEGRTSIWEINSTNMMTAGPNMDPEISFKGKGLKIKALQ